MIPISHNAPFSRWFAYALVALPLLVATEAWAQTGVGVPPGGILGGKVIVATTGDVTATFLQGSGAYSDFLYLQNDPTFANPTNGISGNWIFENHLNHFGDQVDLGTFTAGTELQFMVAADTLGTDFGHFGDYYTGDIGFDYYWYTGPGSRNSDGDAHAFVNSTVNPPTVGFEDLPNLGDAGYEDIRYTFTNVEAVAAVPDLASTLSLLGLGVVGIAALRRRLKMSSCV